MIIQNFGTKFLLRRGECKTLENSNFLKKGKIVISIKIQNFSRSRMTKRTSQNQNLRDKMGIMEMFNENKTKKNRDLLLQKHKKRKVGGWFNF